MCAYNSVFLLCHYLALCLCLSLHAHAAITSTVRSENTALRVLHVYNLLSTMLATQARLSPTVSRYRTLRQGKEMGHPVITEIAARHSKTPAQVLGRWCVQQNIVYIPKSEKRDRMVENMQVHTHICMCARLVIVKCLPLFTLGTDVSLRSRVHHTFFVQVFDFELSDEDMAALGSLTTAAAIDEFKQLYEKCTVRDTPLAETKAGVKTSITYN